MKPILKLSYIILYLFLALSFTACGDDKDEPSNPVISFLSLDKNIIISNGGTNAVVNSSGIGCDISIALGGDFSNYKLETVDNNKILYGVKVENRTLSFSIQTNWTQESRSANITITANNASSIVKAELVVNQVPLTHDETRDIELEEIDWYVNAATAKEFPKNGNIAKDVWYKLNNDGTAFARLVNCADNRIPINKGQLVKLQYAGTTVYETSYSNDWWLNPLVSYNPYDATFTFNGITTSLISKYGKGLLLPLELGICFGDDFDIVLTSDLGVPDAAEYRQAFVYAVQYYEPNSTTEKNAKRR